MLLVFFEFPYDLILVFNFMVSFFPHTCYCMMLMTATNSCSMLLQRLFFFFQVLASTGLFSDGYKSTCIVMARQEAGGSRKMLPAQDMMNSNNIVSLIFTLFTRYLSMTINFPRRTRRISVPCVLIRWMMLELY